MVDRAGHWPQEEQPEIVSQQLRPPEVYVSDHFDGDVI